MLFKARRSNSLFPSFKVSSSLFFSSIIFCFWISRKTLWIRTPSLEEIWITSAVPMTHRGAPFFWRSRYSNWETCPGFSKERAAFRVFVLSSSTIKLERSQFSFVQNSSGVYPKIRIASKLAFSNFTPPCLSIRYWTMPQKTELKIWLYSSACRCLCRLSCSKRRFITTSSVISRTTPIQIGTPFSSQDFFPMSLTQI